MCDYDDYFYDGHYDDKPDYFDSGDFEIITLVCMVLLGRIIMGCIMICMGLITLGCMSFPGWCRCGALLE